MKLNYYSYMKYIKDMETRAINWLISIPTKTQTRHMFDPKVNVENMTNDLAKLFNNWLGKYKSMPILMLLEKIRLKFMVRFYDRFVES